MWVSAYGDRIYMKKLLLLFSLMLSFNSYGETYVCAFTCYLSDENCQSVYKRVGDGFTDVQNGDLLNLTENETYLSMSNNSAEEMHAGVSVVIINKNTLKFMKSLTSLIDAEPPIYSNQTRDGKCVLVD